jgi:hypothetical protein
VCWVAELCVITCPPPPLASPSTCLGHCCCRVCVIGCFPHPSAFGGLVGQLVGLLFGGGASASSSAAAGPLKVTSSLGFSATTPEEAVAALVVRAQQGCA